MKHAARQIIEFMGRNRLTQAEMARRLEVSQPTLCNWLEGTHGITKKNIARIKFICGDWENPAPAAPAVSIPDDMLFDYVLKSWGLLTVEERARIVARIDEILADKKTANTVANTNAG